MAALHDNESTTPLISRDGESPAPTTVDRRRLGGWTTTPFILATVFGLTLASGGFFGNLIVFLIEKFNIKTIDAAQISSVLSGCINFFPLVGAILADSLLGCFSVIWISSLISLLGLILVVLTVTIDSLRADTCNICTGPSTIQYTILYSSLALVSIGAGGTRFTLATMGANQFSDSKQQSTYFNWFFFSMYSASFISGTVMVYVEDNLGWGLGLGICIAANVIGLGLFLIGSRYYNRVKRPHGSPVTSLLQVVVASVRKRKAEISSQNLDYYYGDDDDGVIAKQPTKWFRSLNRAALKTGGRDILQNGSITNPWKLCTVEQVEDLKSLIRVLPLWTTGIFLSTPIGIQLSLTVLQALTTNRHLSPSFQLPPGTIGVFSFLSTLIGVALINHCIWPLWKKLSSNTPTLLQQIGIGHVVNVASMAVSALVEVKRRRSCGTMSVLWLLPQMGVVGVGEAFHFPGHVGLFYQEFPASLRSLATAMVALLIGVAFYLSAAVVDFVRRVTDWLPDDINDGRVDSVYWVMVVIGVINFGYYLLVSWLFKCKKVEVVKGDDWE